MAAQRGAYALASGHRTQPRGSGAPKGLAPSGNGSDQHPDPTPRGWYLLGSGVLPFEVEMPIAVAASLLLAARLPLANRWKSQPP